MTEKKSEPRTFKAKKAYVETYRSTYKSESLDGGGKAHKAATRAADAADRRVRDPSPQQRSRPKK